MKILSINGEVSEKVYDERTFPRSRLTLSGVWKKEIVVFTSKHNYWTSDLRTQRDRYLSTQITFTCGPKVKCSQTQEPKRTNV